MLAAAKSGEAAATADFQAWNAANALQTMFNGVPMPRDPIAQRALSLTTIAAVSALASELAIRDSARSAASPSPRMTGLLIPSARTLSRPGTRPRAADAASCARSRTCKHKGLSGGIIYRAHRLFTIQTIC